MSSIRVGLIGCGYWGPNFLRLIQRNSDVQLISICDTDQSIVRKLRTRFPTAEVVDNLDDFYNHKIEAVIIASPVSTHFSLIKRGVEEGVHILCEKPMCGNLAEAEQLKEMVQEYERIVMFGHIFLYHPVVKYLKKAFQDDRIGDILYLSSSRNGLGPIRDDVDVTFDLASHDISILLYLLEEIPQFVNAYGSGFEQDNSGDVAFITLGFSNDIVAHINVSWIDPVKQRAFKVVGKKGMMIFDDISLTEKLKIYQTGKGYQTKSGDFGQFQLAIKDGDIYVPNIPVEEPLETELNHFLDCIIKKEKPLTDVSGAFEIMKVLDAIRYSLKSGGEKVLIESVLA